MDLVFEKGRGVLNGTWTWQVTVPGFSVPRGLFL